MQGAKRLEQAVENLEKFLKQNPVLQKGEEGALLSTVLTENLELKARNSEAKKRLDQLISNLKG